MNLGKTTSYALSALSFLAGHQGQKYSAKRLHEILEIPWPYLSQLLTSMTKSGFITSVQGRNGGFVLLRSADLITPAQLKIS